MTTTLIEYEAAKCFDIELDENQRSNIAEYLVNLPSELGMNLGLLSHSQPKHSRMLLLSTSVTVSGKTVREYMMETLQAKQ